MTKLSIYKESEPQVEVLTTNNFEKITDSLSNVGINLRRWKATQVIQDDSDHEAILAAYQDEINALVKEGGYQSWDVVTMYPTHPDKVVFRQKFLKEHTHSEDEIRFFVRGQGLFVMHIREEVYSLLCEQDDLISVPAGTKHWFDMGPNPEFTAIRLFNNPEGWVAQFTGSDIASHFPRLEN